MRYLDRFPRMIKQNELMPIEIFFKCLVPRTCVLRIALQITLTTHNTPQLKLFLQQEPTEECSKWKENSFDHRSGTNHTDFDWAPSLMWYIPLRHDLVNIVQRNISMFLLINYRIVKCMCIYSMQKCSSSTPHMLRRPNMLPVIICTCVRSSSLFILLKSSTAGARSFYWLPFPLPGTLQSGNQV